MAFVTTTTPDLYATTSNLEEIPAGADPLQYADDDKMNQILVGLTALHGWASGVPVSETANGHFMALAAGSSAAVSVAAGVRIRQSSGALDYSYNTGAYARLLSKLTLASQATGDIMYASAADTWTRLAAGTNGYVLTLSGGVPTWAASGGGGGGIAAGDNVTWTGNHAWNTGTAAFANSLGVTGTLTVTGGATISTTLGLAAGAAATPSLYQTGDTNTGIYFPAADQFAITTAGSARLVIDGSTLLSSLIVTGPAGSASLPTYGFTGDPNTGAYSIGADQYGITAGGTLRLTVSTTGVTSTLPLLAPNGAVGAPAYSFASDTDSGLFSSGANSWSLVAGGASSMNVGTAGLYPLVPVLSADGSVSAPTYAFNSEANTGAYRSATGTYSIAAAGVLAASCVTSAGVTETYLYSSTAATNSVQSALRLQGNTSGTAAVGYGVSLQIQAENAAGNVFPLGEMQWAWTNATNPNEASDLLFRLRTPGTNADAAKLTSVGAWQVGAGSAALPSLSFLGDTNTGLYSSGADEISTTIGGTQRHKLGTAARWKFGAAALEDAYLVEVCTDAAGASNSMRTTNSGGVAYYFAKADDTNAGAYFAHYGSGNADTFCGGSNTNSTWIKAIGGHLSVGTNTAAKNLYLGANNVEFIQCVAGGEIKFSQMFKTIAGNEQTTIGAAGGASALPATPTKYIKFKDSAGTTLIIPAYAAA